MHMLKTAGRAVLGVFLFAGCAGSSTKPAAVAAPAGEPAIEWGKVDSEGESRFHPSIGVKGMVVADDPEAARWGVEILRQGGNAVDAAVATAFAMSVTRPQHSSIGGGGFMVYCPKPKGDGASAVRQPCTTLDYREEAPAKATRDMYVKDGKAHTELSQNGALAPGVPGVTAGLLAALEKYGSFPRAKVLAHPIRLAREGFRLTGHQESIALERWADMNDDTRRLLGCDESGRQWGTGKIESMPKAPCAPQTILRQPELAKVLETISAKGAAGFYQGWVAEKIATGLQARGGIMTVEDLQAYRPRWREPVTGEFRGMEVVSMPPPSAGGTVLLMMLGYAGRADAQAQFSDGFGAARSIHALAHGMSLAFADRAQHFGDPGFWQVPTQKLLSNEYLDSRWKSFDPSKAALPSAAGEIASGPVSAAPSGAAMDQTHTTHFSVIDRDGNAVAITTTINDDFGSGFTPPGTGVVMNNEMDDFSIQPGTPNLFGLVGAEANAVAPRKRPLSSMTPTIVRDAKGAVRLVLGAAGGPRITTAVFQTIFNRLRFGMSIADALAAPRVHQQWKPEELKLERQAFGPETRARLSALGYQLKDTGHLAVAHALERFSDGRVWGIADPRGDGDAIAE